MASFENMKATLEVILPETGSFDLKAFMRSGRFDHIYKNFLNTRNMRILLIEDEPIALKRLKTMLSELSQEIEFVGEADSVETAYEWLATHNEPDAIFTDVQLADGTCFDLFAKYPPKCPVVFITAYNHYAVEAFKVNAQDYLLKPLKKEELAAAYEKISNKKSTEIKDLDYTKLAQAILKEEQKYDRRYLIRYGEQVRSVQSDEIAYAYTTHKAVFLVLFTGKEYPLDKTMDQLEKELDPKSFFRINRQFIVSMKSIGHMHVVSKSRVQIELTPEYKADDVIVSTEKSPLFKEWLGGD